MADQSSGDENSITQLSRRLEELTVRVERIESLFLKAPFAAASGDTGAEEAEKLPPEARGEQERPPSVDKTESEFSNPLLKKTTAPSAPPRPAVTQAPAAQSTSPSGGKLLGGLAVACFVLAGAYFIELAIDSGWLTPARQLAALVLFSSSLIGAGFYLREQDTPYASLLPGVGIVLLSMCAYAGHLQFALYGPLEMVVLAGGVSCFSLFLFQSFKNDFFAFAALVGTYATPILVETVNADMLSVTTFFLFWDLLFIAFAVRLRRRYLITMACYLAIASVLVTAAKTAWIGGALQTPLWPAFWLQTGQFLLFAGAMLWFSVRNKAPLTATESNVLLPVLVFFYATQYAILYQLIPEGAPYVALLFGVLLIGVYQAAKVYLGRSDLPSARLVYGINAVVLFHAGYLVLLPEVLRPLAGIVSLAALGLGGMNGRLRGNIIAALVLFCVAAAEYLRVLLDVESAGMVVPMVVYSGLYAGLLFVGYRTLSRIERPGDPGFAGLCLIFAVFQALPGLHRLAVAATPPAGAAFATSFLWAVLALAMLLGASVYRDKLLALFALGIFALTAVKVLFADVASDDSIMRVISLLVVGALLYGGGYLWRRINNWETPPKVD